ncbi:hypothetical protein GE061_013758 [Apolygus lucorum]|uniref:CCDC66 domain-containing protein n=1 Tax=Apolygus lucorum TaxID=248454 RepID=A0A8S9XQR2_APOLU|nr:hypothetical protein GE061_013758 [Apolygus lucorum]
MDTFLPNTDCPEGGVSNHPSQDSHLHNEINISEEIEKYLDNLTRKDIEFIDPKLKRERQKLQDLLTSYKKLSENLDKKCAEASKEGIHVPTKEILARRAEINALLHPELYKNRREEEKNRLIEKFSSRRHFSEVDKVCPLDLTPIHCISDKRQEEKDRFCKLLASAPSRFHNILGEPYQRFKRLTRPPTTPPCLVDVRETEKDRLARIFATSAAFIRDPNLKRKLLEKYKETNRRSHLNSPDASHRPITQHEMVRIGEYSPLNKYSNPRQGRTVLGIGQHDETERQLGEERRFECLNSEKRTEPGMCQSSQHSPQENPVSQLTSDLHEMVRIGEYSPLNKYSDPRQGRTVLGIGQHDETERQLGEERRFECLNYEKENQAKFDKAVMVSPSNGRRSVSSASTQTDDPQPEVGSPVRAISPNKISFPRDFVDVSPREKLLSDLYGYRPNGDVAQEEKIKRIAYAQALQEQIKEKKRLEEERKKREREEEELEERRYREQAERIQKEYDLERNLKLDYVIQRQVQEEVLRKRLAEMNMEAKDLKRRERLSRLSNERDHSPEGSIHNLPSLASAYSGLQAHENGVRFLDREMAGATSAAVLPEQLPEADFEEDWSKISRLEGVDLLREHRSQKERLQLPPVVDPSAKIERRRARPTEKPQVNGYVPSSFNDSTRRAQNYRQQAEAILRAPLDDEILHSEGVPQRSAVSLPPPQRTRSPVLPAVRTGSILKRNSRILDDKWQVPQEGAHDLARTLVDKENVLTQLGAFRRQLAQEHHKLEERIRGQSSS